MRGADGPMKLIGLHHVTAVSARIRENREFYTGLLGLRLVKRTVNQDDVSAYHLFYADGAGSPGTDMTFFDWDLPRERRGTRSIARTGFRVRNGDDVEWWRRRLADAGVPVGTPEERDGRVTLQFEDPEGQRLMLVADGGRGEDPVPWPGSPVPDGRQLRGLGPIVLSVPSLDDTATVLTEVMNLERIRQYSAPGATAGSDQAAVHVFSMAGDGPHAEVHVAVESGLPPARPGAGGVHHVAFRTPDEEEYRGWVDRLRSLRVPNSGPVDRFYFRSLYFREPSGILFEIATDGPGFAVDEEADHLGEGLALPPFLEPRRNEIEAELAPID